MERSPWFAAIPAVTLASALLACAGSSTNPAPEAQLPDSFGDCDGASVCQVSLSAFTKDASVIPYCPTMLDQALASLECGKWLEVSAGACGALYSLRFVYGPPGDHFQCVYSQGTGQLVGAFWVPDNHPKQVAGTLPPVDCALNTNPCAAAPVLNADAADVQPGAN